MTLDYQPFFHGDQIVGVEALFRLQDAPGLELAPAPFIDVAEETGLISTLTRWVLNAAVSPPRMRPEQGRPDTGMAPPRGNRPAPGGAHRANGMENLAARRLADGVRLALTATPRVSL